jgi:hypothetical protein
VNCESNIKAHWQVCGACGHVINKGNINCIRCFHLIESNLKYCTSCGFQQFEEKIDKEVFEPVAGEISIHTTPIRRSDISASLRFDRKSIFHILGASEFFRTSVFLMILASFTMASVVIGIQIVFSTEEGTIGDVIKGFVFTFWILTAVLFSIAFFSRNTLIPLNYDVDYRHFIRYLGMLASALIIKDIFMIPAALYIYVFEGKDGSDLAEASYIILTLLVIAFLLVHFLVLIRSLTGTSNAMSFILVLTIIGLTATFSLYVITILDAILRL